MIHKFTAKGNPVPYTRVTQRSKYVSRQYKRYAGYKSKILAAFFNSIENEARKKRYLSNFHQYGKPLKLNQKAYVWSKSYFKDGRHGDPDNIHKGILDALFVTDKKVVGAFDFDYDEKNPRLEVFLTDNPKKFKDILGAEYYVRDNH